VATPLTPAHHRWRIRIFATTWLTYVAFYFCRKPFSVAKAAIKRETGWATSDLADLWAVYLIAYAIGQFLASDLGTRLGPRRNVLVGMVVSIAVTLAMGVTLSLPVLFGLMAANGLAQATGWSGTVGTMAGWFHKHERGRVMGAWSTNFTVGSIASGFAMAGILKLRILPEVVTPRLALPDAVPWRWCFYAGALVLGMAAVQFFVLQRNRPEDVGLAPVDDPVTPVDEAKVQPPPDDYPGGLSRDAWTNLLLVGGFYFFSKFVRYAVWSWSAFLLSTKYGMSDDRAAGYSIVFDLCGIPGVYLTGYVSDRFYNSRRGGVSLAMMLGMIAVTVLLIMFRDAGVEVFILLLGLVGFTLYGPDALLTGAGAMDIGGRRAATFATAVISGFGSMGPIVQEVVIGRLYDTKSGDLTLVLVLLCASAVCAALFCAALVWRNRRGGRGI
jgi:OPA family glycerol-3-phosphate transporter-like MFS transporter